MAPRKRKIFAKYWGYILLPLLYLGWFYYGLDPMVLGILSGLVVLYGLFQAPVPCSAITREGYFCRYNAKGLLRGCHLQQHKWQNLRMLIQRQSWARLGGAVFRGVKGNAAALTVLAGLVSAFASAIVPFLT